MTQQLNEENVSDAEADAHAIAAAAHEQKHHFQVDDVRQNLRNSSARGGALMIGSHAVQLVVGVAGTAALARLLRPQDFGYLAMVASFTSFVATFRDFGLPMAAVHKQQLSHGLASGLFWINAVASVCVVACIAAMAPVLAWFYSEPKLVGITLVMAGGVFAHSLSMVHVGLLRRQMKFAAVTILEISAVLAGVIVGVSAALLGAGYWALVFQQTTIWITQSLGAQILCRWRPARRGASAGWRDPELRSMVRYGSNLSAARLVSYFGRNADIVFVGYFAGSAVLGLYQKANQWAQMPFSQVYGPLLPVAVASFSRLQDDLDRYRSYVRTTLLGCFALTLPATLLLLLDARPVVLVLLGSQWNGAIPFFRILTVGAYFGSFALVTKWLFLAEGRTGDQLRWSTITTTLTVAAVAVGAYLGGAMGVARGFAIATIVLAFPGVWYCLRRSPLRWSDFLGAVWRPTIASLLAAAAFMALRKIVPALPRPIFRVLVDAVIFGTFYVVSWLALPGGRAESSRVLAHLRLLRPS